MAGEVAAPGQRQRRGHAEEALRELLALARSGDEATRAQAAGAVLGLTGDPEGRQMVAGEASALLALSEEDPCPAVARDALRALVNLAAAGEEEGEPGVGALVAAALRSRDGALPRLLRRALDGGGEAAALLANASRDEAACRSLWGAAVMAAEGDGCGDDEEARMLARLLDALGRRREPHLAALLCNLSRLPDVRRRLLEPRRCVLQRLLPLVHCAGPDLLRQSVIGTLRNCCFDYEHHRWLLSDEVDLLPFLLLPLAGPEEFPEDEMESLPLDLQYLPAEKQREPDPALRKMLLETIMLLTATKPGRQLVREKGTYVILRELHRWESDPGARAACEKLIHVLIADEPEAGMENLLEVEIPAEVEERLRRLDQEEEEGGSEEPTSCAGEFRR